MTEPNENIAPGRGTATRTSESDEGKASGRGIMSLDAVRRLAWTAIVLFIMAIVFAFNHGPILAWLAANHTPLLVGILQAPLWLVAFLLIVLGLQCWLDIVEVDKTPFAIILHALGIMLCIGWWAAGIALSLRQRADEWHEYWGENAPLLEDSADLAEAEQAETDRIRSEQMRAAAKRIAAGMPEPGGEIHVDSYRKADGTVVRGYTSETFALKAACNPLADD